MNLLQKIEQAAGFIQSKTADFKPQVGIILGTGLSKLTEDLAVVFTLSYDEIPHFVTSTVEFHSGKLLFGYLADKPVVCMQGRFHYYEGYSMEEVTFPVRVMKLLGITHLFVSNAAGGMNPVFKESDLMLIEDHIALFLPENPLVGPPILGERFPDMSAPYCPSLLARAFEIAKEEGIELQKGVYVSVTGPQLETKAEYKMLRMLGADAVGMSTVPEVLVAVQMGLTVFGVSVITDLCIPETLQKADISKILAAAYKAEPQMTLLIKKLVASL
ncbi:MAG: purine-nucleoside phosphorylase [Spirosomataceae bacterium]